MKASIQNSRDSKVRFKFKKQFFWTLITVIALTNIVAIFHSYKFTHYLQNKVVKTKDPKTLSTGQKLSTLLFGINNPRPANGKTPTQKFETVKLRSNREIECWSIKSDCAKGTVIIFHGFGGQKSSMLEKSNEFLHLGYNTLVVDFMGSGGSEGNQTTIGYFEAEQVKTCFDYLREKGEQNIYLFGTSMGAVAIMKSINDYQLDPAGIIIECPFGSMYETVCARFKTMNAPVFPMAGLLVFWGGLQNGFWAFGHNPIEYAKSVHCPALLMYGALDEKVSRNEIDEIFANLKGKKELRIYEFAGHENYLTKYKYQWTRDIEAFIEATKK